MIRTSQSGPTTVSFVQKGRDEASAKIASAQIAKAARAEVDALSAADNAQFRLQHATEQMKAAEVAYQDAVAKSAWNREELRKSYNNAIAGYREADKAAEIAAENLALASAALNGLREVAKREFSADERKASAAKGHAMPDGSFPIESKKDLENAVRSYGRSASPEAAKAHIKEQAKRLGAEDSLPENWVAKSVVRKDDEMANEPELVEVDDPTEVLVACPECNGFDSEDCDYCHGEGLFPIEEDYSKAVGSDFTTESLLTRAFEKSAGYQNYIAKGGKGSGRRKGDGRGHLGNQHTGGMRFHPRLIDPKTGEKGLWRGWKDTLKLYTKSASEAQQMAQLHENAAERHEAAGRYAKAAEEYGIAANAHATAAGNFEGIASTHAKEREAGNGDHPDVKSKEECAQYRTEAAKERARAARAKDNAERLMAMAA